MSKIIKPDQPQIIIRGQSSKFTLRHERVMNAVTEGCRMFSNMLSGICGTRVDVCLTVMIAERGEATTHATVPPNVTIKALEETLKHLKADQKPAFSRGGESSDVEWEEKVKKDGGIQ